jgi:hypothetical protein
VNPAVLIPIALAILAETMKFINQARAIARQDAEWTPEQEAAFDARIRQLTAQPHWQPTPKPHSDAT